MSQETSQTQPQYVLRLLQRSEIPMLAQIQTNAFNDPTNTTPDELSRILNTEIDPSQGRPLTRQESIQKQTTRHLTNFDSSKYTFVGVYLLPPSSPSTLQTNQQDDLPSTTLPQNSQLVGYAMWQRVDENTPKDSFETETNQAQNPSLLNRFFATMTRTREATMHGKTYWYLKLLAIDPPHQRKGLGTRLVKWGVEKANNQHLDAYLESSPMGKGTYLKAGFTILGHDRLDEPRAEMGYLEWPYMIHEFKPHT